LKTKYNSCKSDTLTLKNPRTQNQHYGTTFSCTVKKWLDDKLNEETRCKEFITTYKSSLMLRGSVLLEKRILTGQRVH